MFGIGEVAELITTAANKIWADANIDAQAKADALKAEVTQQFEALMGQIETNKIEASSSSVLVSGWRPALGWVCVSGFAYEFVLRVIFNGVLVGLGYPAIFVGIEVDALETLLFGMLGLGSFRTFEKFKGVASK